MVETIYGDKLIEMEEVRDEVIAIIDSFREKEKEATGEDPVEHVVTRIKDDKSMREKCRRRNLPETADSALNILTDAIGVRVVCAFRSDVYLMRDRIANCEFFEVIEEKDYIKHSKDNGYRSYHMILKYRGYFIEIQIRTISMDTWAALEHQMKYKKKVNGNVELISSELKRCADDLASTDISMQTLRNLIRQMEDE